MLPEYPTGGRDSFFFALGVGIIALTIFLWKLRREKDRPWIERAKEWLFGERTVVKFGLLTATFVAIWIASRTIGFYFRVLLFEEDYIYSALKVLDVIAVILLVNLCITLLKSTEIREIAFATMQSVLIALLVFLPRATSLESRSQYGDYGSAVILVGFSAILITMTYVLKFFGRERT